MPSCALDGKSPYEMLHRHHRLQRHLTDVNANANTDHTEDDKLKLHHLQRFGCLAFRRIPKERRIDTKMGAHSKPCTSGKKIYVWTHRLRPDAPGAQNALDTPWQGRYRSQHETHRQCEFGSSTPWHRAFGRPMLGCRASGRSMPWHRAFGRRMPGRRASGCSSPWHLLTRRSVSGHFPSGHSRVRAFSFWMQPCQGIFLLDAAVSEHFPSGRSCVRANGVRTTRVMAPQSRCLSRHGTS